jgi:3D (Asp-Asp-Asp) domain-containing protein
MKLNIGGGTLSGSLRIEYAHPYLDLEDTDSSQPYFLRIVGADDSFGIHIRDKNDSSILKAPFVIKYNSVTDFSNYDTLINDNGTWEINGNKVWHQGDMQMTYDAGTKTLEITLS